jgi:hypothetical protein
MSPRYLPQRLRLYVHRRRCDRISRTTRLRRGGYGSVAILAVLPMPLGSTVELFIPPTFAGPRGIPLIGTFPIPAEPAGRENAPIAAKPACPPRANEAAGGVKNMNNAIATFAEALDIGSTTMIHWNGEAMGFM